MKTETLIELQRSIAQGEWRITNDHEGVIAGNSNVANCHYAFDMTELFANARAIALVPELLSEVIGLRIALGLIVSECSEQQVTENAIVTSRPSLLCLEQCRAALVNDK